MNLAIRRHLFLLAPAAAALAIAATGSLAQTDAPSPQDETSAAPFKPLASTTIGIEGKVMYRVEAGGPRLIARPVDRFADVNLRIADVTDDGTAKLYDLRFIAQRAGRFDLREALERIDGGPMSALPAAPVAVGARLDPEHDGELIAMQDVSAKPRTGYRATMIAVGSVWLLVPIAYAGWRLAHRKRREVLAPPPPPPTLADQLAPMVELARTGRLDVEGRATLERLVIAYWRKRLHLQSLSTRAALDAVKADPKAGMLLNAVERWLHAPPSREDANNSAAEAMRLLEDYRNASAIQLDDDVPLSGSARAPASPSVPAEVGP
jgi:hypothetical protein